VNIEVTHIVEITSPFKVAKNFNALFIKSQHLSLFWDRWIQYTFRSIFPKIHYNIISQLCVCFPSGLFPSGFKTKTLYALMLFPFRAACSENLILTEFINRIIYDKAYKLWSSNLCSLLQSHPFLPLSQYITLSSLFSGAQNVRPFLGVRDHVSHTCKTIFTIIDFILQTAVQEKKKPI